MRALSTLPQMPAMRTNGWIEVAVVGLLAGCGAEVASTAATTAKLQVMQAEQAKAQAEQLKEKLDATMRRVESAASAAATQ